MQGMDQAENQTSLVSTGEGYSYGSYGFGLGEHVGAESLGQSPWRQHIDRHA